MSSRPDSDLETIVAGYFRSLEAGTPQEIEELLARHPDCRAELAEFFDMHSRLAAWTEPMRSSSVNQSGNQDALRERGFQDYLLLEPIGQGGMGVVYRAFQRSLEREVALKMVRNGRFATPGDRRRFRAEIEIVARLDHPGIITVYDVGEIEGQAYYVMKLAPGGNLTSVAPQLLGQPRPIAELMRQLAVACQYAHEHGILHRDLKPANILLDAAGCPYLADFGLAKDADASIDLTHSGDLLGSPSYMAPEQASGTRQDITAATDVYGLGAVLYFLLTGQPPFRAAGVLATLEQVRSEPPVPPRHLRQDVPRDLEAICMKCLAKEPCRRYPSAGELEGDLNRFLSGSRVRARRPGLAEGVRRACRRRVHLIDLIGIITMAAVFLGGLSLFHWWESRQLAQEIVTTRTREEREAAERRRFEYVLTMERAGALRDPGSVEALQACLESARPGPSEEEVRGFEWFYLWRLGRSYRTFRNHARMVESMAVSSDGSMVAGVDDKATVRVWDSKTQAILNSFQIGPALAVGLEFAPDERHLVTNWAGQTENGIKVWDLRTAKLAAEIRGPRAATPAERALKPLFAFSSDRRKLYVLNMSPAGAAPLQTWAFLEENQLRSAPSGISGYCTALQSSWDGRQLAYAAVPPGHDSKQCSVYVAESGRLDSPLLVGSLPAHIAHLQFAKDGTRLLGGTPAGDISLFDLGKQRILWSTNIPVSAPYQLSGLTFINQDATVAAVAPQTAGKSTFHLFDSTTGKERSAPIDWPRCVPSLCNDRAHDRLLFSSPETINEVLWPPPADALRLAPAPETWAVAFDPKSRWLASAGDSHTVKLWDVQCQREIRSFTGHSALVAALAFSPQGTLVSASFDGTVKLWNPELGRAQPGWKAHLGQIVRLALTPDGSRLASAARDGSAKIWDFPSGRLLHTLPIEKARIVGLDFSPDGQTLAVCTWQGVQLWDCARGFLKQEKFIVPEVHSLHYTADGHSLIMGHQNGELGFWNARSLEQEQLLPGHVGGIVALSLSPDGRTIASAGSDKEIRLWNVATRQHVLTLSRHKNAIRSLAFAPDGNWLASGGHDGDIFLWPAR